MGNDRIRRLLTSKTAKLAQDANTNIGLDLMSNSKPFADPNLVEIISQTEVFNEERELSSNYRVYGNVKIITTNEVTGNIVPTDDVWALNQNNWEVQIVYPSNKDYNFIINSRKGTVSSKEAFRGVPLETQNVYNDGGDRYKLGIQTNMKHNLEPSDYFYVYGSNMTYKNRGIYRVEKLGDSLGDNPDYNLVTSTIVEQTQLVSTSGNLMKIINPSQNDITYYNPTPISNRGVTTDGLTNMNSVDHQVVVNDFIEIRSLTDVMNGIFLVKEVIDDNNFKIDLGSTSFTTAQVLNSTTFRRLDGTPSEYYVRKFEVITTNDYETHKTAFSKSIYPETLQNNFGIANTAYSYQLNRDINVSDYTSHRGGTLTELYVGFIKKTNGYDWSNVVSDWEDNFKTTSDSSSSKNVEYISVRGNSGVQKNLNNEYVGDFVEFNRLTLIEATISETIHRFTPNSEINNGYYHKPFKKLQIRVYSNNVEKATTDENIINLPTDIVTYPNGDKVWKDILSIGYFEEATNGVDYPFKNNSHYFYNNNILYIRVQIPNRPGLVQESFKVGDVEC